MEVSHLSMQGRFPTQILRRAALASACSMLSPVTKSDGQNGAGGTNAMDPPALAVELAEACVRFVEAALGVRLDFSAETLPLLDHYVASRREELVAKPETIGLVARAAGAYFGELVRRQFHSFWHAPTDDPSSWEL